MEDIEKIKEYVFSRDEVTIPELQKHFSLSYQEAWQSVQTLIDEKSLVYQEGIIYKVIHPKISNIPKNLLPFEELFQESSHEIDAAELNEHIHRIIDTLAAFKIDAEFQRATVGAAVTRYDFSLPQNVDFESAIEHELEIAVQLHAYDGIRIYENPKTEFLSVEVPNSCRNMVSMSSVVESNEYREAQSDALVFAVGKDVDGNIIVGNFSKLRHILISGTTNSGLSVFMNVMLTSMIEKYSPEELRLVLIDPKGCEFPIYNGIPHLVTGKTVTEPRKAISALNWVYVEIERRYQLFSHKMQSGVYVRSLDDYNQNLSPSEKKLPRIVIVINELSHLMNLVRNDIEDRLMRIAQKSCAAGIYLVVATQRPAFDVLTESLTKNFPTHIAFRVVQEEESHRILGESGAEKLIGFGDMLMTTPWDRSLSRIQGAYISYEAVNAIVQNAKANDSFVNDDKISFDPIEDDTDESEPLEIRALRIVVQLQTASISLIQRKCQIGYNHAGKILEWMEKKGYVAPFDSKSKGRAVLLTRAEFEKLYGPKD